MPSSKTICKHKKSITTQTQKIPKAKVGLYVQNSHKLKKIQKIKYSKTF